MKRPTMLKIVDSIEKFIIHALIIMMLAAILLGTIELGRVLILEIFAPPLFLLDVTRLFEGFGLVLVILIGVELHEGDEDVSHRRQN